MTIGTREPNPAVTCIIDIAYYRWLFHEKPRKGEAYVIDATRYEVVRVQERKVYLNARKWRGYR